MKHEPRIAEQRDPTPVAEAIAQARLDYQSDRGVLHAVVSMWLRTWGQPNYKPFERWLFEWDG